MADDAAARGSTVGVLMQAMDLLDELPPAATLVRERGYATQADLVDGLGDPDADVRRGCLELLDDPWAATAAPHVVDLFDDPEWSVRYCAVHAFARDPRAASRAPGSDVLPAVIRTATTDSSRFVRMLATEIVGGAAATDAQAGDALAAVRDGDHDASVRRKAARYAPGGALHGQG